MVAFGDRWYYMAGAGLCVKAALALPHGPRKRIG
jgi:hypothetical protein